MKDAMTNADWLRAATAWCESDDPATRAMGVAKVVEIADELDACGGAGAGAGARSRDGAGAGMTGIPDHANPRTRPPGRRTGGRLDFAWGNIAARFTVGFTLFPTGAPWRCAEVFLNVSPSQGGLEKEIRDAGILSSFALQHGATLDALVAGVTHEEDGSASSLIGTALALVPAEIARMRDGDGTAALDGPPAPGDGAAGAAVSLPAEHAPAEAVA